MDEKWSLSGTGYSIKTESGQIVFEYRRLPMKPEPFIRWLEYAEYACQLHNEKLDVITGEQ